jgi:hypothetical protein
MAHALKRVSYASCDAASQQFAFVAREPRKSKAQSGVQYCHVYRTHSAEQVCEYVILLRHINCYLRVQSYFSDESKKFSQHSKRQLFAHINQTTVMLQKIIIFMCVSENKNLCMCVCIGGKVFLARGGGTI